MKIKLNGKETNIKENRDIENFLIENNILKNGVVVIINEIIIKKENWKNILLNENDVIEILNFVSGG